MDKIMIENLPYIDITGWLGNYFFVHGAILLAKKQMSGWICQIAGNVAYLNVGISDGRSSLWFLSILLILTNLYGIYQWKIMEKN